MTTLLKQGIHAIVDIFYKTKNKPLHLRELSRRTGMYGQSISRYLKELEKRKILTSEMQGNLKLYSLQYHQAVYAVLTMFDVEKVKKLPVVRRQAISTFIHSLSQVPVFAILFGSTAKETYQEDSDIDILIVTHAKIDARNAEKEVNALHAIKISTFQMTLKEFIKELKLKQDPVVQSAVATGYPVLNNIYYYEVLHNERV